MTYRKNSTLNATEWFRLNDDDTISTVVKTINLGKVNQYIGKKDSSDDWDNIYNYFQHINAREFNDAYNLVKENI